MAHLVEIYKGLSKVRKVQPIDVTELPKALFDAYVENTVNHYEKLENRLRRNSVPDLKAVDDPVAISARIARRRLRRRTLATIGTLRI